MRSSHRIVSAVIALSLSMAAPVTAQRSGFVVGFGLGPGYYSAASNGQTEGKFGLGVDFHIGGALANGLEIYFFEKLIVSSSDIPGVESQGTGVAGVGVAFPVSSQFDVHGGIGSGVWSESSSSGSSSTTDVETNGLGLALGGRYKLNESGRWMLNVDLLRASEPIPDSDLSVWAFQMTVNIMSH